jgi:serine/threonine-protein kinase RsbW
MVMEVDVRDGPPPLSGAVRYRSGFAGSAEAKNRVIESVLSVIREKGELPEAETFRLKLCLDEAIQNSIDHGNRGDAGKQVEVSVHENPECWQVVVRDQGPGFRPEDLPDPAHPSALECEGGRGLLILKEFSDGIRYYEGGRTLVITKKRRPPAARGG